MGTYEPTLVKWDDLMVLEELDIDIGYLQELQMVTFQEPGVSMPMTAILDQILACRRGLHMTVKHMVMLQKLGNWELSNYIDQLEQRVAHKLEQRICS